ncbi:MAG: hypothetical protein HOO86_01815 [Bacteroidales bacterium]|nr:hypothetical protein [Bacteroidales bacterium]
MKTKNDILLKAAVLIIGISIMAIYTYFDIKNKDSISDALKIKYPPVDIHEHFGGEITDNYKRDLKLFRNDPNRVEVTINDSLEKGISVEDEMTTGHHLDDLLEIGDFILKEKGSTVLLLFKIQGKDTLQYSFHLTNEKGYPLKSK